ncbi:MAG: putative motility protein [Caulobacteraceae bacterium]
MDVSMNMADLNSVRQAIGILNLQKAMKQDASTVAALISGMQETSAKMMELSVTPHIGSNIDISV